MLISDLHNDILNRRENVGELAAQDTVISKIVCAVFRGSKNFSDVEKTAGNFLQYQTSFTSHLSPFTSKKYYLAFEDCGYLDYDNLQTFLSFKPFYASLTYNGENEMGFGCRCVGGLKQKGKEFAKILSENNIISDIAHLSKKSALDVLDICGKVICSHTCFCGYFEHKRNIDDEIIKLIIQKNGIVGLTFVGEFLCGCKASAKDCADHIDYYANKFGTDSLCIGSDFYGTDDLPADLKNYFDFENLYEELHKMNYNREQVDRIFYKNADKYIMNSEY